MCIDWISDSLEYIFDWIGGGKCIFIEFNSFKLDHFGMRITDLFVFFYNKYM